MNGLLNRICYHIGLDTLNNLLGFVKEQNLYVEDTTRTTSDFPDGERELLPCVRIVMVSTNLSTFQFT